MPGTFGYWTLRGLGQPIRFLMAYTDEDVQEKRYTFEPIENAQKWFAEDKPSLGLDFPNLPYYVDGQVKLTHSMAILRYLGRKHNMDGHTEQEKAVIDMVSEEIIDLRKRFYDLCYEKQFDEKKVEFKKTLTTEKLKPLEKFLGDKPYFVGTNITWVDFMAYEVLDQHRVCWADVFQEYPKLSAFLDRFEALPKIKAYMASDMFIKSPMLGPFAVFRGVIEST